MKNVSVEIALEATPISWEHAWEITRRFVEETTQRDEDRHVDIEWVDVTRCYRVANARKIEEAQRRHRDVTKIAWEPEGPKRQGGGSNPSTEAPKASCTDAARQRDPREGPTPPPDRDSPPVLATGVKASASEAAAILE